MASLCRIRDIAMLSPAASPTGSQRQHPAAPACTQPHRNVATRYSVKRARGELETDYFFILDDNHPDDPDLAMCIILKYNDVAVDKYQWTYSGVDLMRIPSTIDMCNVSKDRHIFKGKIVRVQPGTSTADTDVEYHGQVVSAEIAGTMAWRDVKRICDDFDIALDSCRWHSRP